MDVETLTLANECTTVGGKIQDFLLGDFPDSLVDSLDVVRDVGDVLNGTVVGDDHVLHVVVPKTKVNEFTKKPWADNLEFTSENTTGVYVAKRQALVQIEL